MLYQEGLAEGNWTTQLGALSSLGVSQSDLSLALQLEKLPEPIVDLFEDHIEISSHTVRVIRHTIIHDGLDTVLNRVQRSGIPSKTLSNKGVLSIVKGRATDSKRMLRGAGRDPANIVNRALDLPKSISDRYHLGMVNGEWDNFSACARAIGVSRRNISDAVAIRELPDAIRHLFSGQKLTFSVGRRLLALKKELGIDELLSRARNKEATYEVAGRTADNILSELNHENVRSPDDFRVVVKRGRGRNRLVIECKAANVLFRYRAEIRGAIRKILRKRIRSARHIEDMQGLYDLLRPSLPVEGMSSTYRPRPPKA
jgi:hypothetical protein